MNNSFIHNLEEENETVKERLRIEEARIVKIIEAINAVDGTKEWQVLKVELFDNFVNNLEKDLKTEARKPEVSPMTLNRLSGELKWAEKYSDLSKLEQTYRVQLKNIRIKLYGNEE